VHRQELTPDVGLLSYADPGGLDVARQYASLVRFDIAAPRTAIRVVWMSHDNMPAAFDDLKPIRSI
jgi:hypothetical protein